jgi:hypothetical protein
MFRTRFAVHVLVPAVLAAAAALAPAAARADSSLITTAAGYEANTVLPSLNPKGMDVFGDWIAV